LFSYAGDQQRDTLKGVIKAKSLYPRQTVYQKLGERGVDSHVFGVREYTPSSYSNVVTRGAKLHSFKTLPEALVNMGSLLETAPPPVYVHFYFDNIDGTCHKYGPSAPQTQAEIEAFLLLLDHFFELAFTGKKRMLFLMTADHGACEVDPKTTIFLNREDRLKGVESFFKTNQSGELLVPAGSARDMFLYIRDEMLTEAEEFLAKRLEGQAEVVRTSQLLEQGYFGPEVSARFRERVGNLVILPHRYESVWWFEKDRFEQNFYGHHGGLTPQEMEIPFLSLQV
jgi:predicted AlkP superfamily pyrophosphatase or phosphodiesterase